MQISKYFPPIKTHKDEVVSTATKLQERFKDAFQVALLLAWNCDTADPVAAALDVLFDNEIADGLRRQFDEILSSNNDGRSVPQPWDALGGSYVTSSNGIKCACSGERVVLPPVLAYFLWSLQSTSALLCCPQRSKELLLVPWAILAAETIRLRCCKSFRGESCARGASLS